jgi:2,4-dienoyl-CoA reductase-like NADH-dependent reductase (Old Yellow Enzyme family)
MFQETRKKCASEAATFGRLPHLRAKAAELPIFFDRGCPVSKSILFSPIQLAGVTFPNRVFVSPMCQYSSQDGFSNDWHLVHLGSRAVGGAALVFTEAASVLAEGRITPEDLGLWKDDHITGLKRIVEFVHAQGAHVGVQLAHAGRKASMARPWAPEQRYLTPAEGGWQNVMAPSAVPFADNYGQPIALDLAGIQTITRAFARATERALEAGFDLVELHAAHGYLLHEFLSPLSNRRTDEYGGGFENRIRLLVEVVDTVRAKLPAEFPLLVRISATDWVEGGWDLDQSVALAKVLKEHKVDLVDVSSGGMAAQAVMAVGPGYQTPFADRIRREAKIPTGAVGMITAPAQAEHILRTGQADVVLLARELLRDPYWPLHAARELGDVISWPAQYLRAAPHGSGERQPIVSSAIAETATI